MEGYTVIAKSEKDDITVYAKKWKNFIKILKLISKGRLTGDPIG